jgi:hypothetical protein
VRRGPVLILLLALLPVAPAAYARTKYDRSGKVEYHPRQMRDLLAGRTDLFYDGDYVCTPGDEHHAPDCRKNWWVIDAEGYRSVTLDDGTQILVFDNAADMNNVFARVPVSYSAKPAQSTFHYHLGKIKNGMREIEIEGVVGKGYYKPWDVLAPSDQHCLALAPERQAECLAASR